MDENKVKEFWTEVEDMYNSWIKYGRREHAARDGKAPEGEFSIADLALTTTSLYTRMDERARVARTLGLNAPADAPYNYLMMFS